jgi:hypothetical protein
VSCWLSVRASATRRASWLPLEIKPGDQILFGKWSGTEVKMDGEDLLIMKEDDIMDVVESAARSKTSGSTSHKVRALATVLALGVLIAAPTGSRKSSGLTAGHHLWRTYLHNPDTHPRSKGAHPFVQLALGSPTGFLEWSPHAARFR